jgi:ABC-2 type transport system permease protein
MSMLTKITTTEARLMLRDIATPFFAIVFPPLLLAGVSLISPGFTEPIDDPEAPAELLGVRMVEVYVPVVLAVAIATVALTLLPQHLATYRQRGVLRRMAATPASPRDLLTAQLLINLSFLLIGALATVLVGVLAFDVPWPSNSVGVLAIFVLAMTATGAVGLIIAALAPSGAVASGIGTGLFFVAMLFSGVWTPGDTMPNGLRAVADFTPFGAAAEAISDAWDGGWPTLLHVLVLIGWAAVAGFVATRVFRWE